MKSCILLIVAFLVTSTSYGQSERSVFINREKISSETVKALESSYNISILDGRYWYDRYSGLWGMEGGPTVGVVMPGLQLGGDLPVDAANGNTGVFLNGLELHAQDVRNLTMWLGVVNPGRYWMDAAGNVGYEGGPAQLNLWQLAQRSQQSSFYRNSYTGIGGGSSGGTSYVIGKDFSVIVDH
ncbi:MAG: hypothetical protein AAF992_26810 [Bacteroidota bacterium]